jgi:hypothetical protein
MFKLVEANPGGLDPEQPGDDCAQDRGPDQTEEQGLRADSIEENRKQESGRHGAPAGNGAVYIQTIIMQEITDFLTGLQVPLPSRANIVIRSKFNPGILFVLVHIGHAGHR